MAQLSIEHIAGDTYFIPSPTNIGIYVQNDNVILIDSGNDKEAGRQILRLLKQQGWNLKLIINTHANADHIGGNAFLQERTGCGIFATKGEAVFINEPLLEPAFLYGGFPHQGLRNKFLTAKPSLVTTIIPSYGNITDTGLQAIPLPGHYFDMIGVMTPDGICFISDVLFPENIIKKYHLFFLWDIRSHFNSLERLKTLNADLYVPGHGEALAQVNELIETNQKKINEILFTIQSICEKPVTAETILEKLCVLYGISLNANQYVLLFSTVRSYLSYLLEEGLLECDYADCRMEWKRK